MPAGQQVAGYMQQQLHTIQQQQATATAAAAAAVAKAVAAAMIKDATFTTDLNKGGSWGSRLKITPE